MGGSLGALGAEERRLAGIVDFADLSADLHDGDEDDAEEQSQYEGWVQHGSLRSSVAARPPLGGTWLTGRIVTKENSTPANSKTC